jgi:protein O-mannosyl-transferase
MGERFMYISSLGFCMLLVMSIAYFLNKQLSIQPRLIALICTPIILLYSLKTIARNPDWKNNISLYTKDVQTYPESAFLNGNACNCYLEKAAMPKNKSIRSLLLDSAIMCGKRAVALHPKHYSGHMNLGIAFANKENMDSAAVHYFIARDISPYEKQLPDLLNSVGAYYYNKATPCLQNNDFAGALANLNLSHKAVPNDFRPLYYLGVTYQKMGDKIKAKEVWLQGLAIAPNDDRLKSALASLSN